MLLSPDVVDLILGFLQADTAALKSCIQAHPLLSKLAERHLYYRTTVDIKPGGDLDITELSSLLSKNPHIKNYIRILTINIVPNSLISAWTSVSRLEAILSILSTLPHLNKVALKVASRSTIVSRSKNEFHQSFRLAFADILQQSSVTEVHLEGLSAFPLSLFCQNIKTLSLSSCRAFKSSNLTSPSAHLESLSIRDSDNVSLFRWAIDRAGRLTSLKLRPKAMEFSPIPWLFRACAESLTSLELDIHDLGQSEDYPMDADFYSSIFPETADNHNVEFPFTLSVLSHLEYLTISAVILAVQEEDSLDEEIMYHDFVFYSAIHAIARLIESSAPSLLQVVLRFSCHDFANIDSLIEVDWAPLILLGDSPTCPHIDLCISGREADTDREFSLEEITNTLAGHTRLLHLVNRGVLTIKPEKMGSC